MNRWLAFFTWVFAFVGALFWFAFWSMLLRNYVHGKAATAVSGLSGLIPLVIVTWAWSLRERVDKHRVFRKAVLFSSGEFGLAMLCASAYMQIRK